MSKRILTLCAAFVVIAASSNAFASRARVLVMGTGDGGLLLNGGSFYYDDEYNIFYNPAYVNEHHNWAILEKNNGAGEGAAGAFTSYSGFNFGAYLNRPESIEGTYTTASAAFRPLELFVGSDMGVKWGARLSYAVPSSQAGDINLGVGAIVNGLEPFADIKLMGKETNAAGTELKNSGFRVGTKYHFGEWIPYAALVSAKHSTGGTEDLSMTNWGVGVGRSMKLAEGARLNYSFAYVHTSTTPTGLSSITSSTWPLDLSVEGDAASWITLRGGFTYAKNSSTKLGASIHAGKADVNWAIGSSAAGEALDSAPIDVSHGFFTATSIDYHW